MRMTDSLNLDTAEPKAQQAALQIRPQRHLHGRIGDGQADGHPDG